MSVTQSQRKPKKLSATFILRLMWEILPQVLILLNDNRDNETPVTLKMDYRGTGGIRVTSTSKVGDKIDKIITIDNGTGNRLEVR